MGKYKAVPAAEAYARDGENRPACECGGELKKWLSRSDLILGGRYVCRDRAVRQNRAHQERKKTNDLCHDCTNKVEDGKHLCRGCRTKRNTSDRERRVRRREDGQCPACGNEPAVGLLCCRRCLDRQGDYEHELWSKNPLAAMLKQMKSRRRQGLGRVAARNEELGRLYQELEELAKEYAVV